ncbi:MAG: O-antigen polymerase [Gemmatimonadaceae bacterium]
MRPDASMQSARAVAILLTAIAAGAAAALLGSADRSAPALVLAAFAAGALFLGARAATGHWTSLAVLCCGFFAIYGLSGPLHAVMGERLADLFTWPYRTSTFLVQQGVATIGLATGLIVGMHLSSQRRGAPTSNTSASHAAVPLGIALGCVAAASLMELTTFVRVGGLPAVALGKAVYQSRASALPMTLPSDEVAALGIALVTLWFSAERGRRGAVQRRFALLAASGAALPVVGIALALGRRGPLFAWVLIGVLGATMHRPLRRLSRRLIALGVTLVLASGLLFASRATIAFGIATGDWQPFRKAITNGERIVTSLNPAESEFGAAFGNFSEYAHRGDMRPRLGTTYVAGLATLVPGFLYPGEKPVQITYEFRDRFFPSEAARGDVAGTGFSSILEAYLNFGTGGVLMLYALVGALLVALERWRHRPPYGPLAYLLLVPLTQSLHRSASSVVLGGLLLAIYLLIALRLAFLAMRIVAEAGRGRVAVLEAR